MRHWPCRPVPEIDAGSSHPRQEELDRDFTQAMIALSPQSAWNALRRGANGNAYVYTFCGVNLTSISREGYRHVGQDGVHFFNAGYAAVVTALPVGIPPSNATKKLTRSLLGIMPHSAMPCAEDGIRECMKEQVGYVKPVNSGADMLDVALELSRQGVNPKIEVFRRDAMRQRDPFLH